MAGRLFTIVLWGTINTTILGAVTNTRGGSYHLHDNNHNNSHYNITQKQRRPLSVGAYYYPWHGRNPDRHWGNEGYLRNDLNVRQEPFLGEYSNQDRALVDQHFQWAQDYGIDFLICSWWGIGSYEDTSIKDYMLKSENAGDTKIALFFESTGLLKSGRDTVGPWPDTFFDKEGEREAALIGNISYIAETYFDHPMFLRVDGKPVLYFYTTWSFYGNYEQAFTNLRETIRSKYGHDMYLVGDAVIWAMPPFKFKLFDAVTTYNPYFNMFWFHDGFLDDTGFVDNVESLYMKNQKLAESMGVDFIPNVIPGYNDRSVRIEADNFPIPRETSRVLDGTGTFSTFASFLNMARRVIAKSTTTSERDPVVMITSFNEWHEDTQIEPVKNTSSSITPELLTSNYTYESYGFKLLEMVRDFVDDYNSGN